MMVDLRDFRVCCSFDIAKGDANEEGGLVVVINVYGCVIKKTKSATRKRGVKRFFACRLSFHATSDKSVRPPST